MIFLKLIAILFGTTAILAPVFSVVAIAWNDGEHKLRTLSWGAGIAAAAAGAAAAITILGQLDPTIVVGCSTGMAIFIPTLMLFPSGQSAD